MDEALDTETTLGRNRALPVPRGSEEPQCCTAVAAGEGSSEYGQTHCTCTSHSCLRPPLAKKNGFHPLPSSPSLINLTMSSPESPSDWFLCEQFKITAQPHEAQRTCASSQLLCFLVMAKAFRSSVNNNRNKKRLWKRTGYI